MSPPVSIENIQTEQFISSMKNDSVDKQQHPDIAMIENNNETYIRNSKKDRRDEFLTFDEPIFNQFFTKNITKELYLEQIHIPRRLNYPARFFRSDFLESLTKTYWWTPPAVWFPSAAAMFMLSTHDNYTKFIIFIAGIIFWSFLEYVFHRFVFHSEESLPDNKYFLVVHFFTHAVHHWLPFDGLRLAMPPALFLPLATITWFTFRLLLCTDTLLPLFSGIFVGFTCYDLFHYYLHHGAEKSFFAYVRNMRTYHSIHHYKQPSRGYGVTSKLWDVIFDTSLLTGGKKNKN